MNDLAERLAALEALYWSLPLGHRPRQADLVSLGLDDVLWPEQLKAAHREYTARGLGQ